MKHLALICIFVFNYAQALNIVTANPILASIVKDLVGDADTVTSVLPNNQDPHLFELKPNDIMALNKADLVVFNGEGLESWELKYQQKNPDKTIFVATAGLDLILLMDQGKNKMHDPHFWHDPRLAVQVLETLSTQLSELNPSAKPRLAKQVKILRKQYLALYDSCRKQLRDVKSRVIVTSHDAFSYMARAYDLKFLAPQGWSSQSEPRPQNVASIRNWITSHKVGALFFENGTESPLLKKLAGSGDVKIGNTLYSDTLSSETGPASTYQKMIKTNCEVISQALK